MSYRLGLDLGTNSIGWSMVELDPDGKPKKVIRAGVRLFSDGRNPKDKTSLAVARRMARSARRRRDRYLKRRARLFKVLVSFGLMPKDKQTQQALRTLNPYELRNRAAMEPLRPYELGRALFHLNQRRGFKSSRKIQNKDEQKEIGPKIRATETALGEGTLGEYLWSRMQKAQPVRCKHYLEDLYFKREMLENEFSAIRKIQSAHQNLNGEQWEVLRKIIFFQRPLQPIEPAPCTLDPSQKRMPSALPSFQEFRILHDISNLRLIQMDRTERDLTYPEREALFALLNQKKELSFEKIREELELEGEFNLESEVRPKLKGNVTSAFMAGKSRFGKSWHGLSLDQQDTIVETILADDSEVKLLMIPAVRALSEAQRGAVLDISEDQLPAGHCRFSSAVLYKILPCMRQGMRFEVAKEACGYGDKMAEASDRLEYYGKVLPESVVPLRQGRRMAGSADEQRYGRIPNPTVHIGMGQLRRLVNRIIDTYGKPDEIHMEIVRDLKMNREQKIRLAKQQNENKKNNDRIRAMLEEHGLPDSYDNRMRVRLWEELGREVNDRCCPYTGKKISFSVLFSEQIEVEHILPWAQTLDDSASNKTVCFVESNREKKNRSPFEAWGGDKDRYDEILMRASTFPKNKRWRFDPDAMERMREEDRWLARQLVDTAYLARIARKYLSTLMPSQKVRVSPGRLTALLRHHWGLNSVLSEEDKKDRKDHRHHAVDAIVVALTDERLLHSISRAAGMARLGHGLSVQVPWLGFRDQVADVIDKVTVSHRVDHSPQGRLFAETAYGTISSESEEGKQGYNLVARKPVVGLTKKQVEQIRDPKLRESLMNAVKASEGGDFGTVLDRWSKAKKVSALRVLEENKSAVPIKMKMLIPDNLNHVQIWRLPNGELYPKLIGVQGYEMLQGKTYSKKPHPAAKLIMKIHKGDTAILESEKTGKKELVIVFSLRPANNLIACRRAGLAADGPIFYPSLSTLKAEKFRVVHVDEIGRIKDGGPRL